METTILLKGLPAAADAAIGPVVEDLVQHRREPGGRPTACHPRNLILAGKGSQASVVEVYLGPEGATYFTNAVSVCPVCTPYRAALLTGCYSNRVGIHFHRYQSSFNVFA